MLSEQECQTIRDALEPEPAAVSEVIAALLATVAALRTDLAAAERKLELERRANIEAESLLLRQRDAAVQRADALEAGQEREARAWEREHDRAEVAESLVEQLRQALEAIATGDDSVGAVLTPTNFMRFARDALAASTPTPNAGADNGS